MRSSPSKASVDWADSSTPAPSISSATHDVPGSDAGDSAGPRAAPAGAAVWHAERARQNTSAENRSIGLTVYVLDTASAGAGKLDLGPEQVRGSDPRIDALYPARRDVTQCGGRIGKGCR